MSNNSMLFRLVIHIAVATILAVVATQTMGQIGIPSFAGTFVFHGYEFDLVALAGSHLVAGKVFFS